MCRHFKTSVKTQSKLSHYHIKVSLVKCLSKLNLYHKQYLPSQDMQHNGVMTWKITFGYIIKSSKESCYYYFGCQNFGLDLWGKPNQLPCLFLLCPIIYGRIAYVSGAIERTLNTGNSARHLKNVIPLKSKCYLSSKENKSVLKRVISLCLRAELFLLKTTWISIACHCCTERTSSSDIYLEGEILEKVFKTDTFLNHYAKYCYVLYYV